MTGSNVMIAEILLKVEMDDLKDAGMLADYAEQVNDLGDTAIAQALITRARNKLTLMTECEHSIKTVMSRESHEANEIESVYEDLLKKYTAQEAERIRVKLENI